MASPAIIVHGGAWAIPDELVAGHHEGVRVAAQAGYDLLNRGACAEDAVEAAVRLMEDDPVFDAGRGSHLNADGLVELDAAMMEGAKLEVGAVASVRDIANPITLARHVMASPHCLIVGEGATRFAESVGIARCTPEDLAVERELALWQARRKAMAVEQEGASDTVGAICLDARGHLVAGVSTGGTQFKWPGRVGDVPCCGCGFYADDALGAAVSTGHGEAIMRGVLAQRAVRNMEDGNAAQVAAERAIAYLVRRIQGRAGLITLDTQGRVGCAFSTPRMARAWSDGGRIVALVERDA